MKIFQKFTTDIGIDLGTASTLVYVKGKGIVINEPSVVAVNQKTGQILAIGSEAKKMVGRTPANIIACRPLVTGVISDFEITEEMIRYFLKKVKRKNLGFLSILRVVIGIPSNITEVEKRAVEDAARNAGAKEIYLVEEPLAAAIGIGLPIQEAKGSMIVDIGGGTTDIVVISLGGIVVSKSLKVAGDKMTNDIIRYAQDEHKIILGERTAEEIKILAGSASELDEPIEAVMRGRDILTGLPKEIVVNDKQIRNALRGSVFAIVNAIKDALEETPPELLADIMQDGMTLVGGGALLKNFDILIQKNTLVPTKIAEDPLTAVVRGTGIILEDINELKKILTTTQYKDELKEI